MRRACVVSASGQNVFFEEMLAAFETALAASGVQIERSVDHFPAFEDGVAYLFVPHEFLPLTQPSAHPSDAHLRRSVALCTEQPGTQWFEEAAGVAARAGRAIDINPEGTAELRRRGVSAETLQLGYVPEWDHWQGDEARDRPFDLTFMGGYTPRRAGALASCAHVLMDRRAALHLFDTRVPHTGESEAFFSGARKWEHLASSKAIVNIHRSPLAYLEWQRIIGAIENGCVVVTEHSLGAAPLQPGVHYVSTDLDGLPATVRALLDDPARLAEIRRTAYTTLREELPLSASIHVLADALDEVSRASVAGLQQGSVAPRPAPLRTVPPAEYERMAMQRTETDVARMALKQVVMAQKALERRLDQAGGPEPSVDVEHHGPAVESPRVSVVVTLHNYANVVGEAIRSVALSSYEDLELVVVEDASTDDSLDVTRRTLSEHPWLTASVVSCQPNRGLAGARNLGVEHARGSYVFILDADNLVHRHALERLAGALDEEPEAAFAYGILEVFDHLGPRDLMSWLAWDPHHFRYGNYVDAMAMIRRSALLEAGGYTTDPRLYGWEDFDLWCGFADRGWWGRLVPEILGRYRSSLHSMISITDIDASSPWSALLERHPSLTREVASEPAAVR
jgi:Glycosyl transferase family 2